MDPRHLQWIHEEAQRNGLDPLLLEALIRHESGGDPKARSSKGAEGLGQIMPATAKDPGPGIKPIDQDAPEPVRENIRLASDYLAHTIRERGGRIGPGLQGYNAGLRALSEIEAGIRPLPKETAEFPKKVRAIYDRLVEERKAAPEAAPSTPPASTSASSEPLTYTPFYEPAPRPLMEQPPPRDEGLTTGGWFKGLGAAGAAIGNRTTGGLLQSVEDIGLNPLRPIGMLMEQEPEGRALMDRMRATYAKSPIPRLRTAVTEAAEIQEQEALQAIPENALGGFGTHVAQAAVVMAPQAIAAMVSKKGSVGEGIMAVQVAMSEYNRARAAGLKPAQAAVEAGIATGAELGPEKWFGVFDNLALGRGVKAWAKSAALEAPSEMTTEALTILDEVTRQGEDFDFVEAAKRVGYAGLLGAALGGVIGAPKAFQKKDPLEGLDPPSAEALRGLMDMARAVEDQSDTPFTPPPILPVTPPGEPPAGGGGGGGAVATPTEPTPPPTGELPWWESSQATGPTFDDIPSGETPSGTGAVPTGTEPTVTPELGAGPTVTPPGEPPAGGAGAFALDTPQPTTTFRVSAPQWDLLNRVAENQAADHAEDTPQGQVARSLATKLAASLRAGKAPSSLRLTQEELALVQSEAEQRLEVLKDADASKENHRVKLAARALANRASAALAAQQAATPALRAVTTPPGQPKAPAQVVDLVQQAERRVAMLDQRRMALVRAEASVLLDAMRTPGSWNTPEFIAAQEARAATLADTKAKLHAAQQHLSRLKGESPAPTDSTPEPSTQAPETAPPPSRTSRALGAISDAVSGVRERVAGALARPPKEATTETPSGGEKQPKTPLEHAELRVELLEARRGLLLAATDDLTPGHPSTEGMTPAEIEAARATNEKRLADNTTRLAAAFRQWDDVKAGEASTVAPVTEAERAAEELSPLEQAEQGVSRAYVDVQMWREAVESHTLPKGVSAINPQGAGANRAIREQRLAQAEARYAEAVQQRDQLRAAAAPAPTETPTPPLSEVRVGSAPSQGQASPALVRAIDRSSATGSLVPILDYLIEHSPDLSYRVIAERVKKALGNLSTPVRVYKDYTGFRVALLLDSGLPIEETAGAVYWPGNSSVYLRRDLLDGGAYSDEILLHESIHAVLRNWLALNPNHPLAAEFDDLYNTTMLALSAEIDAGRDPTGWLTTLQGILLEEPEELITYGLTNDELRAFLNRVPMGKKSAWERFTNWVASVLRMPGNSALRHLLDTTDGIFKDIEAGDAAAAAIAARAPPAAGPATAPRPIEENEDADRFDDRLEDAPFHSQLAEVVTTAQGMPKRGSPKVFREWLDGQQRKGSIKQEERDWLGVDEWLDKQQSVTREALQRFVYMNQVVVREEQVDGYKDHSSLWVPGGANPRELILTLPYNRELFTDEHYGNMNNPVAHVRFTERTGPDGKRVLFVEEVQSDWHQRGRREGYGKQEAKVYSVEDRFGRVHAEFSTEAEARTAALQMSRDEENIFTVRQDGGRTIRTGIADAPFKKTWPLLVMKRMIRWAAENGFDRVEWTTGDTQAQRYDLSKHIATLVLDDNVSGGVGLPNMEGEVTTGRIRGLDSDHNKAIDRHFTSRKELESLIGRELAERLIAVQPHAASTAGLGIRRRILAGQDLVIGGEGMKGFYDRMLPSMVNDYVRKWGAKVQPGQTPIPYKSKDKLAFEMYGVDDPLVAEYENYRGQYDNLDPHARRHVDEVFDKGDGQVPTHSLDITPEMRKSVVASGTDPMFIQRPPTAAPTAAPTGPTAHRKFFGTKWNAYDGAGNHVHASSLKALAAQLGGVTRVKTPAGNYILTASNGTQWHTYGPKQGALAQQQGHHNPAAPRQAPAAPQAPGTPAPATTPAPGAPGQPPAPPVAPAGAAGQPPTPPTPPTPPPSGRPPDPEQPPPHGYDPNASQTDQEAQAAQNGNVTQGRRDDYFSHGTKGAPPTGMSLRKLLPAPLRKFWFWLRRMYQDENLYLRLFENTMFKGVHNRIKSAFQLHDAFTRVPDMVTKANEEAYRKYIEPLRLLIYGTDADGQPRANYERLDLQEVNLFLAALNSLGRNYFIMQKRARRDYEAVKVVTQEAQNKLNAAKVELYDLQKQRRQPGGQQQVSMHQIQAAQRGVTMAEQQYNRAVAAEAAAKLQVTNPPVPGLTQVGASGASWDTASTVMLNLLNDPRVSAEQLNAIIDQAFATSQYLRDYAYDNGMITREMYEQLNPDSTFMTAFRDVRDRLGLMEALEFANYQTTFPNMTEAEFMNHLFRATYMPAWDENSTESWMDNPQGLDMAESGQHAPASIFGNDFDEAMGRSAEMGLATQGVQGLERMIYQLQRRAISNREMGERVVNHAMAMNDPRFAVVLPEAAAGTMGYADAAARKRWTAYAFQQAQARGIPAAGTMFSSQEHAKAPIIRVKRGEKEIAVVILDKAYAAALVRHYGSLSKNPVAKAFHRLSTIVRRLYTTWNPDFIAANSPREWLNAILQVPSAEGLTEAQGKAIARRLKNPKEFAKWNRAIWKYASSRRGTDADYINAATTPEDKALREFMVKAAKAGMFTEMYHGGTLEELEAELARAQQRLEDRAAGPLSPRQLRNALRLVGRVLNRAANTTENAPRAAVAYHAYKAIMDEAPANLSAAARAEAERRAMAQAARVGKNLAVNYKRYGVYGRNISKYFFFFNPAVQGGARSLSAYRFAFSLPVRLAVYGAVLRLLNELIAGDDEEGRNVYETQVPDWVRERNVVVMIPGTEGEYFSIPLPFGHNATYAVGEKMASAFLGHQDQFRGLGEDLGDETKNLLALVISSFTPITAGPGTAGNPITLVTPSMFQPFVEMMANLDWRGLPIEPMKYGNAPNALPDSWRMKDADPDDASEVMFRGIARALNAVTGGDQHEPGLLDLHPAQVEHLFKSYTGAVGTVMARTMETVNHVLMSEYGDAARAAPIIRKFYGLGESRFDDRGRYYELQERMLQLQAERKDLQREGDKEKLEAFKAMEGEYWSRGVIGRYNATEKRVRKLSRLRTQMLARPNRTEKQNDRIEQLDEQITEAMVRFNQHYYDQIVVLDDEEDL